MRPSRRFLVVALVAAFVFVVAGSLEIAFGATGPAQTAKAKSAPMPQDASDAWLKTKVVTKLATTKGLKRTHFDVAVHNGTVTLRGVMRSKAAIKKAIAAAKALTASKRWMARA